MMRLRWRVWTGVAVVMSAAFSGPLAADSDPAASRLEGPGLGKAIAQVQAARLQVQQQLVSLQENQQTLQQELTARTQQVEVLESRVAHLTRQLQERQATLDQLQQTLQTSGLEASALAQQRRQLDETRARLTQDQDALVQRREQVEAQQRQHDGLKRGLADAERRATQLSKQLDQERDAGLKANGELVRAKQHAQALEAEAKTLRDMNRRLKDEQQRLTRDAPKLEQAHLQELARVNQRLSDAKLAEQQATAKAEQLARVLRERDQLLAALKKTLSQQEAELRQSKPAPSGQPAAAASPPKSKPLLIPEAAVSTIKVLEVDSQLGLLVFSIRDLEQAREGESWLLSSRGNPMAKVRLGEIDEHGMVVAHVTQQLLPGALIRKGDLVEARRLPSKE